MESSKFYPGLLVLQDSLPLGLHFYFGTWFASVFECKSRGDSLYLREHGIFLKRLHRVASDHLPKLESRFLNEEQMNPDNIRPKLHYVNLSITNDNPMHFEDPLKQMSGFHGTRVWADRRNAWIKAEDVEQGVSRILNRQNRY